MFGSQVLETAIGLALLFFILATAASAVTESISRLFQKRPGDLVKTIMGMLTPRVPDDQEKASSTPWDRAKTANTVSGKAEPFMKLLKDTSIWQAAEAAAGRTLILRKRVGNSYLSAKSFADAVDEIIRSKETATVVAALPESLRRRMEILHEDAKRGIVDVKAGLEKWYDETMSRAEGAYKRWAALVLFLIGLGFAVLGNASTVDVARNLWQDPVTREAAAQAASQVSEGTDLDTNGDKVVSVSEATDKLGELSLPVGWDINGDDDITVHTTDADGNPVTTVITHDNNGLKDFFSDSGNETNRGGDATRIFYTMLGWLLTAFLVMLGGPFWFDLLTRLVAIRGAGSKPPTAAADDTSATSMTVAKDTSTGAAAAAPATIDEAERVLELAPLTAVLDQANPDRYRRERLPAQQQPPATAATAQQTTPTPPLSSPTPPTPSTTGSGTRGNGTDATATEDGNEDGTQ